MTAHASTAHSFELHAGALRLALRPDLGGCIAGLWHRETPILRSVEPVELATAWPSGCYPLVPYSNRIGYARFRWKGHDFTTRPNFGESPHSIHGVGWMRPWERVSSSAVEVVLRYRHAADADWPFAFEATQYFNLTPQSLHVEMVVTNLAEVAQPVGLGWHPYFPKRARSRLHIELAERWDGDATGLPVRKVAQPGIDAGVAHLAFDNCFDGWHGAARIRDERFSLQLSSSLDRLVVYTPPEKDYFCVEPVSHVSNAIHMADPLAHGLRSLAPGESTRAWMQLDIAVV
ncbi:MAG TPA: aldose 1-epimerase [Piscinibacter sp.]|uniref:aldose 1-epimerase n=1 Tax=Piscinibacter sp. TaxID=1903157 RepID=UPI002A0C5D6A|nr:aldose 1-epimerase [Pseudomonadota bacterium]MCW5637831.1 aldose 1-epimerase [Rubrivivax sp.]HNJ83703.1 aldose 1-epimerase [Piscinibacter sp.]HNK18750.1 aldose 1-epimerase [Piscinibacter sp.]